MKPRIPCFLRNERIQKLIKNDPEISEEKVYRELLKDYSDNELHEMTEDEILNLILRAILRLHKPLNSETKLIYI